MSRLFVLLAMIFCHILDDFVLQSAWLSNGKCRSWWIINAPDEKYRYDYLVALIIHSMSWSFMIMLPIFVYHIFNVTWLMFLMYIINSFFHAVVDNAKANRRQINLIEDQVIHFCQIIVTALLFLL